MKLAARIAMALALGAGTALAATPAVAATPGTAVAVFTRVAHWPAGYVGSMTVRNDTTATIDGWRVEFDLSAGTRLTSSYNGVFTGAGDHWTVTNAAWNGHLPPGASATFGWVADGQGTPVNCTLNGFDCAGVPADHTPPSGPGPLTIDMTGGVTLLWEPSADDQGPVRYEVYEGGQLVTTVTDTRYVYATGPALPPRIYVFAVRAVDAAGNPSPLAYRTLGQIWRGDEVPPAPSELQVDAPATGLLRITWTAPPVSPIFTVPPVAGYEVSVDGEPAGRTGATSLIIPAPPAGPHTVAVRSINAVEQLSAPVELTHPVR